MVSSHEAEAGIELREMREANKLQQYDESDAHYVERRVNDSSAELKLGLHITITPCKPFTSAQGEDSEIIPSGYLISLTQKNILGREKEVPSRDLLARLRSAISTYNVWPQSADHRTADKRISIDGMASTSKGVWIGPQTLEEMAKAPRPYSPSRGGAADALEIIANRLAPEKQQKR